jgi:hypothetical protein
MRARAAAIGVSATIAIVILASPVLAGSDVPRSDIRAGSKGDDIGDAFFLREDDTLQIEMFVDDADFIETRVSRGADQWSGLRLGRSGALR